MGLGFLGSVLLFTLACFSSKTEAKKILITGGAGFIGFHTGVKLAEDKKNTVVILDIFDDSYDVELKNRRASILKEKGATVHKGDVCNLQMLEHLFETHTFSHVVHMASKEGTEGSMKDPLEFVKANTECLLVLLKALVGYKDTQLIYTSTYNVLDKDNSRLTAAISLYSALKTGGERLIAAYCHDYGIASVGVRLFSVYGPWGRPDGDIYSMALKINDGKPVQIYKNEGSTTASRDYTFVSDVVNGVLLAMNRQPAKCGEIYNIGSGAEPVSMETVFSLLKEELGKSVKQESVTLPMFEPLVTKADITDAIRVLGYKPQVNLQQGIKEFAKWFKEYHIDKKWSSSKEPDTSLTKTLEENRLMYLNKKYKRRLLAARREYEKKAELNNLPVTKYYHKEFQKFKNTALKSRYHGASKSHSVSIMTDWCRLIDECVAFDSRGAMYSHIPKKKEWVSSSGIDLYVADIDVCKAGLTTCYGNCTCSSAGPSQAEYDCKEGFGMVKKDSEQMYCLELYVPGKETQKEKEFRILDRIEERDWNSFIDGKDYVHFPNKYMDYGVVAYYPDGAGNVKKLKAACDDTYHCMGFTTNGELKGIINHVHRWKKSNNDLYLRDVDYCSMHEEKCNCHRVSPGNYECKGRKP